MVLHGWIVWQCVSSEVFLDTLGEGINECLDNLIAGGAGRGILVGAAWRKRTREKGGGGERRGGEKGREGRREGRSGGRKGGKEKGRGRTGNKM